MTVFSCWNQCSNRCEPVQVDNSPRTGVGFISILLFHSLIPAYRAKLSFAGRQARDLKNQGVCVLVENIDEIRVDVALKHVVETRVRVVKMCRELDTHKTPVPGFEFVEIIPFRIREDEAVIVGVVAQPLISRVGSEFGEVPPDNRSGEINRCAQLML